MVPSTPASPTLPPPSPRSPCSPGTSLNQNLVEPLPQLMTTCSLQRIGSVLDAAYGEISTSSTAAAATNTWLYRNDSNGTICRRNSLTTPVSSPTQMRITTPNSPPYLVRTPEKAYFQSTREDGRQSRMAMRRPRMALSLRVNTGTSTHSSSVSHDSSVSEGVSSGIFPHFPRSMASIDEDESQSPLSDTTTLVNWCPPRPPPPAASTLLTSATASATTTCHHNLKRIARPHVPGPIITSTPTRSPIRKKARSCSRLRVPPPPKYHVVVRKSGTKPPSPTTLRNRIQYIHSVEHLRAPLVPLISVSNGLAHPAFPTTLLQYHLLTHAQLDDLARWYHQVDPPVDETFMYPAWIPAWTSLDPDTMPVDGNVIFRNSGGAAAPIVAPVDIETKRRRFGRFIGLRGCESPTTTGPEGERPDELARRMEREWRRALERAEEEERAWEKGWRGRW